MRTERSVRTLPSPGQRPVLHASSSANLNNEHTIDDLMPRRFACAVGAPRCGTTTLSRLLAKHPDVAFSSVKEPHFFSRYDLNELTERELREALKNDYLPRYFGHCSPDKLWAEGSVSYLYAADRMPPILRVWPDAKFIVAVRDPLTMLPSLHQRLLYAGDEVVDDFAKAWALTSERAQGRRIPRSCVAPEFLRYDEIGRLGKYLERFFDVVGRERCFVAVYDDLVADPSTLYRRLLEFLELPDDGRRDFPRYRAGQGYKIAWLQRLLKRPPLAVRGIAAGEKYRERVKPLDRGSRKGPAPLLLQAVTAGRKRLLRWNKAPPPPIRLDVRLRREIRDTLADDVAHLSQLIGRDLSHWLAV